MRAFQLDSEVSVGFRAGFGVVPGSLKGNSAGCQGDSGNTWRSQESFQGDCRMSLDRFRSYQGRLTDLRGNVQGLY